MMNYNLKCLRESKRKLEIVLSLELKIPVLAHQVFPPLGVSALPLLGDFLNQ